jgi:fused signal recognition particle receptor
MNTAPMILLILVGLVLVFGVGVVVYNRRSSAPLEVEEAPAKIAVEETAVTRSAPPVVVELEAEVDDEVEVEVEVEVEEPEPTPGAVRRFARAAGIFNGSFAVLRGKDKITSETWDELEETLLRADVGLKTTTALLDTLKSRVGRKDISTPQELLDALQGEMAGQLSSNSRELHFDNSVKMPNIWLFVGVNGVGKTTTIGKVAFAQKASGRSVLLAAGDTFRAAAGEQLETWAQRAEVPIVRGNEGGDPSAVIFDAVQSAAANNRELVLGDTAGRLQNKSNLMEELKKVRRVAEKEAGTVTEVLLVIDATTGQNGLSQAEQFALATNVTGVVLTKLDGSAKGGIVFAIETQLGIPVKLVGLGETIGDLVPFDPEEYVRELFAEA